jgi:glycosyltransferase involved in cell wall biosynthesis
MVIAMKKIALFIGSLYGGGAERVTSNLANYLSQKGYGVEILVMSETKEIYHIDKNIKLNFLLKVNERKNFLINNIMRLYRLCCFLIREKDVDLFIVMLPETINLLLGLSFLTNAKIVASERNDMSKYSQKLQNSLKRKAKKADGYVFQTDDARKGYGDSINDIKTIVIPNAIDYSFIRPTYKGKRDKVIVGVGRLSAQKNFELLINAFSEIAKEFDEYQLIIYGEGNEREELETLSSSLGIRERVQLPGNVTNLAEKIEKAEVFVLSSDFEGMPNALIEAMALDCHV